jgi:chaperonin GroES
MAVKVRPLHDRIIVERIEEGEQQVGGIIIPDTAKEKPQRGEIVAVGDGKLDDSGSRIPLLVAIGDTVLYGKYSGTEVRLDDEDYLIIPEGDILAIIA